MGLFSNSGVSKVEHNKLKEQNEALQNENSALQDRIKELENSLSFQNNQTV